MDKPSVLSDREWAALTCHAESSDELREDAAIAATAVAKLVNVVNCAAVCTADGMPITIGCTVYIALNPKPFVVRTYQCSARGMRIQLGVKGQTLWMKPSCLFSTACAATAPTPRPVLKVYRRVGAPDVEYTVSGEVPMRRSPDRPKWRRTAEYENDVAFLEAVERGELVEIRAKAPQGVVG